MRSNVQMVTIHKWPVQMKSVCHIHLCVNQIQTVKNVIKIIPNV